MLRRSRLSGWAVALALLVWLACTAWWRPLAVPDEGRYAGVAWEMIRSGDWLTPTLNGLPYFHKPPLFYWLTASSLSVLGLNLFAARLASIVGGVLGAWALFALVRRWGGPRLALWSTLVLVTQPFYFGGAQYANLDMLVAGCISATIALAAHAVLAAEAGQPHRLALWGAYAMAALGLLAKGLIGLVLPSLVIVLWLLISGRWRAFMRLLSLPGLAGLLVLAAPWFLAMQRLYPEFFDYFFIHQHFQRFTQTGFNNAHPIWYYLPMLVLLTLPWGPAWLWSRLSSGGARAQGAEHRVHASDDAATEGVGAARALRRLMWVWLFAIVGFFSLPASKLPGYVLPALPPLAFLIADSLLARWPRLTARPARVIHVLAWSAAALCVVCIAVVVRLDKQSTRPMADRLAPLMQEGVPLVFVDEFVFDLPFYLARREPVVTVTDWQDPDLPLYDNERKELLDAGHFDPVRAKRILVGPAAWRESLCRHPRVAVVAPPQAPRDYPVLGWQAPVMAVQHKTLWVLDRAVLESRGLRCPDEVTSPGR